MYSLGCDIGGTFTDFALFNHETGEVDVEKCLTTPQDPSEGHPIQSSLNDIPPSDIMNNPTPTERQNPVPTNIEMGS